MRRRAFLGLVGGAAAAWPLAVRAQQIKSVPRVGVLWHAGSADEEEVYLTVLQKAFRDLGYVEGRNVTPDHRFPAEQADRFRSMARELAESKVDVIVSVTALGAREARQATHTIPIVVVLDPDPVGSGLIESLSHPGGNVTGLSLMGVDLSGKRVALFKEAVPNLSRVVLMIDPKDPASRPIVSSSLAAAKALGIDLRPVEVPTPALIDNAIIQPVDLRVGANSKGSNRILNIDVGPGQLERPPEFSCEHHRAS
jgi:putative tryptophan/tyrosine transport system substrate-binding protein